MGFLFSEFNSYKVLFFFFWAYEYQSMVEYQWCFLFWLDQVVL